MATHPMPARSGGWLMWLTWLLCAMPCLPLAAPATAAEFRVGVEDIDNLPMYGTHNGKFVGFGRAVLDAFAEKNGHRLVYVALPVRRLHDAFLVDDALDFKFPDHPAWHAQLRKGLSIAYSAPVMSVTGGMIVRTENLGRELAGLRTLGLVSGFTPHILTGKKLPLRVVENASMAALLHQVRLGRLDAAFVSVDRFAKDLASGGAFEGELAFDPGLPHERSQFHLSTRRHAAVIEEFNAFLKTEQSLIRRLRKQYKLQP